MMNAIPILSPILALAAGAWSLLRAYRQRSVQAALRGSGFIALGFSLGAFRVGARSASVVFSILSIATFLATIFWSEPTVPTIEPRGK